MTDTIDITIVKGATFKASWFVKDINGSPIPLAGYSATSGYTIFNSVSGDIISYYNVFGGFAVVKRYNVTLNKENVFDVLKRDNVFNITLQ